MNAINGKKKNVVKLLLFYLIFWISLLIPIQAKQKPRWKKHFSWLCVFEKLNYTHTQTFIAKSFSNREKLIWTKKWTNYNGNYGCTWIFYFFFTLRLISCFDEFCVRFVSFWFFYSINEINRSSRFCFIDFWFTISVKILFISFIMKYLIFVFFSLFHCRLKSDEQKLFVTKKKLKIDSTKNIERVMKIKRANVTALLWR